VDDNSEQPSGLSWLRATGISVIIAVAGVFLLVYVPNLIVTHLTALVHSARVAIAVAWFFIVLFGLTLGMRWLQGRRVL
jgi:hypothetical protein